MVPYSKRASDGSKATPRGRSVQGEGMRRATFGV